MKSAFILFAGVFWGAGISLKLMLGQFDIPEIFIAVSFPILLLASSIKEDKCLEPRSK